eukprot:3603446-Amphidinium_carterae.2
MSLKSFLALCLLGCTPRVRATGYILSKIYSSGDCSEEAAHASAVSATPPARPWRVPQTWATPRCKGWCCLCPVDENEVCRGRRNVRWHCR